MRRSVLASVGAVGSAFLSALCCAGPILYVSLGVGAGLASTFEPFRPWFLGGAVLLMALAFRAVYGRSAESCVADGECDTEEEARRALKRRKVGFWVAVALVAVFASFPTWASWLT